MPTRKVIKENRRWVHSQRLMFESPRDDSSKELGQQLHTGEFFSDTIHRRHCVLQRDGNLCVYQGWIWTPEYCLWASESYKRGLSGKFILWLQNDHNVVLYYYPDDKPIWATGTQNKGGRIFDMPWYPTESYHGKDAICLRDDAGKIYWSKQLRALDRALQEGQPVAQQIFDDLVHPQLDQAISGTNHLIDGLKDAATPGAIHDALNACVFAIAANLASAVNASHSVVAQLQARQAAFLIYRGKLVQASDTVKADERSAEKLEQALKRNIQDEEQQVRDLEKRIKDARDKYESAAEEYKRKRIKYETERSLSIATSWMPTVSIALDVAAAISDKDVETAKYALHARQKECEVVDSHLRESVGRYEALKVDELDAQNELAALEVRMKGLNDDIKGNHAARGEVAALAENWTKLASSINLIFGSAKVLKLQSSGTITIRPLIHTIQVMVQQIDRCPCLSGSLKVKELQRKADDLSDRMTTSLENLPHDKSLDPFIL